jgi:hypothetical protein
MPLLRTIGREFPQIKQLIGLFCVENEPKCAENRRNRRKMGVMRDSKTEDLQQAELQT